MYVNQDLPSMRNSKLPPPPPPGPHLAKVVTCFHIYVKLIDPLYFFVVRHVSLLCCKFLLTLSYLRIQRMCSHDPPK